MKAPNANLQSVSGSAREHQPSHLKSQSLNRYTDEEVKASICEPETLERQLNSEQECEYASH